MERRNFLTALMSIPASMAGTSELLAAKAIKHDKRKARAEMAKILAWLDKGDYASFKAYGPIRVEVDKKQLSDSEIEKFFREFAPDSKSPKFKPVRLRSFDRNTKNPPLIMYVAHLEQQMYLEQTCYEDIQDLITFQEICDGPAGYEKQTQFWYVYFKDNKIRMLEQLLVMA
jgi:hypothetical protein